MSSCLLCLDTIKDELDSIKTNSTPWQELDISKKLEKHFWSLSTIQSNSWICLPCWQEVDNFHKFYLRIEVAHMNLYNIKKEDEGEEELMTQISTILDNGKELDKDNMAYCFLEPEILIDQTHSQNMKETDVEIDKEIVVIKSLDEAETVDISFKRACNRQKRRIDIPNEDPLAKPKRLYVDKTRKNKRSKDDSVAEEKDSEDCKSNVLKVKEEPVELNESDSDINDSDNKETDENYVPEKKSSEKVKRKSNAKRPKKREENDKFIAEHFKQMFCDICQVPFKDFPDMQKHFLDTHKQQGYVVCCKRKYYNRRLLVDHIHSHLNPDHFKCDQCGKILSDRLRLEKHVLWVHSSEDTVKKYSCEDCGKSFADAQYLRMHKLTHLSEEEKKFPCKECGKFYGTSYLLHRHMQAVHVKKFVKVCHICGKFLSCSSDYKMHMNKHEGIPLPIINCDVCGLRLTTERGLKRHKDTQHPVDGKKDHHCPKCPKISPTLKALRKHINTMHVKGLDHKCTICQKSFKRAEVLREHMASHTGTPLYTCLWCPKTFNSNSNMHAHRKKMHPKEWKEAKLQKYSGNLKPDTENINSCEAV